MGHFSQRLPSLSDHCAFLAHRSGLIGTLRIIFLLILLPHGFGDSPPGASGAPPIRPTIDEPQLTARGIRKLSGAHLTLYTDLPVHPEVETLPEAFDQAIPQWCQYFGIDAAAQDGWHVTGFLMKDSKRFDEAGLIPAGLPPFDNGYCWNDLLWVRQQPSDYYRRHLLLHEGTHSIMLTRLGSCGPPWYMEGVAELLATHRWRDRRLTLGILPANSEEVPMWRRIEALRKAVAAGQMRSLADVIGQGPRGKTDAENYGWCWALAALLDGHPAYRERFRQLPRLVTRPDFNRRFEELFATQRSELSDQWQVFLADLEYGLDIARTAIQFKPGEPLPSGGGSVTVAADRGWQSSGLQLEVGQRYGIRATGRYQIATQPQIWWCEPGGVSIRYDHGRPLGMLLAAIRPDHDASDGPTPLLHPIPVGLGISLTAEWSGTLYLRINDSGAELADNAGTLSVRIAGESSASATPTNNR